MVATLCALLAAAYAPSMRPLQPHAAAVSRCMHASMAEHVPGETCSGEKVAVVGATGYIGKAVVREAVRRGYPTTAVVSDASVAASEPKFQGANVVQADVTNPSSLASGPFAPGSVDVVISCLASRSGSKKDSFAIDYQATLNSLEAAKAAGARHFVMLSAFCVKSAEMNDPYALQFQYAKKDMEAKLREQSDVSYTIVRPTAFFKSVSGQVEVVNGGGPFVYFDLGDGKCATCNPIAEADLAAALVDTITDPVRGKNYLWNLGGPDVGLSMKQQVCARAVCTRCACAPASARARVCVPVCACVCMHERVSRAAIPMPLTTARVCPVPSSYRASWWARCSVRTRSSSSECQLGSSMRSSVGWCGSRRRLPSFRPRYAAAQQLNLCTLPDGCGAHPSCV